MNMSIKTIFPAMAFTIALGLPSTVFAADAEQHRVVIQTEVQTDNIDQMTDIVYEAVLANAATKTLDQNKEWFIVTYRDAQTKVVTRNVDDSAESRYIDLDNGARIERDIQAKDVLVHVQHIDFKMGTGPKPNSQNSFMAEKLILPQI